MERANVHLESALRTITPSQRQIVPSTETSSVEGIAPAAASWCKIVCSTEMNSVEAFSKGGSRYLNNFGRSQ